MAAAQLDQSKTPLNQIVMPALGRPISLGTLFDAKSGQMITGLKAWSRQEIEAMLHCQRNDSMDCELLTDESMSEKAKRFNLDGQLSLSLLSGSISASGSGKYLTDTKENKESERVTYKLEAQTKFEELHLTRETIVANTERFCGATHVVTGIQYGGKAYFIFELEKDKSESRETTSGRLQAQISKCAILNVSGMASMEVKSDEQAMMQKVRVTYKGDFHLDSPPTNFADAMKCIQSIKCTDARSPVTVYLTPLSLLTAGSAQPEPEPLSISKQCLDSSVSCYEKLNKIITTLDSTLLRLRPTLWTQVVKQLEYNARKLLKFRSSLDYVVRNTAKTGPELDAKVDELGDMFPQQTPEQWIESVADASGVLVEISKKFQSLGVKIINTQRENAQFMMDDTISKRFLIVVSCKAMDFSFKRLWDKQERESEFFFEMKSLPKHLQNGDNDQFCAVVLQQRDPCLDGVAMVFK